MKKYYHHFLSIDSLTSLFEDLNIHKCNYLTVKFELLEHKMNIPQCVSVSDREKSEIEVICLGTQGYV